jgi:hypothetical protein
MGAVVLGAFGLVTRGGVMVAVMLTRPAALRRLKREKAAGNEVRLVELYWSSALQEDS